MREELLYLLLPLLPLPILPPSYLIFFAISFRPSPFGFPLVFPTSQILPLDSAVSAKVVKGDEVGLKAGFSSIRLSGRGRALEEPLMKKSLAAGTDKIANTSQLCFSCESYRLSRSGPHHQRLIHAIS